MIIKMIKNIKTLKVIEKIVENNTVCTVINVFIQKAFTLMF